MTEAPDASIRVLDVYRDRLGRFVQVVGTFDDKGNPHQGEWGGLIRSMYENIIDRAEEQNRSLLPLFTPSEETLSALATKAERTVLFTFREVQVWEGRVSAWGRIQEPEWPRRRQICDALECLLDLSFYVVDRKGVRVGSGKVFERQCPILPAGGEITLSQDAMIRLVLAGRIH